MADRSHILFIQKRSVRAGAQTSLARLMHNRSMEALGPAALLGTDGWLAQTLSEYALPRVLMPFPAPRAFATRLVGLGFFARGARRRLIQEGIRPRVIIANDHQECPLALALAKRLGGIPVIAILRSSGIDQRDFEKYACGRCDELMAVGAELSQRIATWTTKPIAVFEEGFSEEEFTAHQFWQDVFPARLLVIGTEASGKGFTDFIEALDLIENEHPDFPSLECDFTGAPPRGADSLLGKKRRGRLRFLGRVNEFSSLLGGYSLALHPSRAETFGMAPIESILAGVPTLVSEVGIVESLPIPPQWRFPPRSPRLLAERLIGLWRDWGKSRFDLSLLQQHIHTVHHIDHTAEMFRQILRKCGVS